MTDYAPVLVMKEFPALCVEGELLLRLSDAELGALIKIANIDAVTGVAGYPSYSSEQQSMPTMPIDSEYFRACILTLLVGLDNMYKHPEDEKVYRLWQKGYIKLLLDDGQITTGQYVAFSEWMRWYSDYRERKDRSVREGFVYIVRGESGFYKIGRTLNPDNRQRTFNVKLPMRIKFEILLFSPDYKGLERDLHRRFAAKRVEGEWFRLTPEDIDALKREFTKK